MPRAVAGLFFAAVAAALPPVVPLLIQEMWSASGDVVNLNELGSSRRGLPSSPDSCASNRRASRCDGRCAPAGQNTIRQRRISNLFVPEPRRQVGLCHSLQQPLRLPDHADHNRNRTRRADCQQPPSSASSRISAKLSSEQDTQSCAQSNSGSSNQRDFRNRQSPLSLEHEHLCWLDKR